MTKENTVEQVLCLSAPLWGVATSGFDKYATVSGLDARLKLSGTYMDRTDELERDTRYKQIIPYCAVKCGRKVLAYQRYSKADSRLAAKWSIGIGGHINNIDGEPCWMTVENALYRELAEELGLTDFDSKATFLGLINDELEPVGKVHLGALFVVEVPSEDSVVNVTEGDDSGWFDFEDAAGLRLEYWSALALHVVRHWDGTDGAGDIEEAGEGDT